jgi:hypothetical protein
LAEPADAAACTGVGIAAANGLVRRYRMLTESCIMFIDHLYTRAHPRGAGS